MRIQVDSEDGPVGAPEAVGAADGVARARTSRRAGRDKGDVLTAAVRVITQRGADSTRFTDVAQASGVRSALGNVSRPRTAAFGLS